MRHTSSLPGVFLCLALAGCAPDAQRAALIVVRDSLGIRIVDNGGPQWAEGEGWSVSAQPLLDVGELEGDAEYELSMVGGAVRLENGHIVVLDGGSVQLKFYDSEGRFLANAGGEGGGPGEFSRSRGLAVWGSSQDSIVVWDPRGSRLSFFDATSRFVRTVTVDRSDILSPDIIGVFDDGRFVAHQFDGGRETGVGTVHRDPIRYVRYSSGGEFMNDVAALPGMPYYWSSFMGRPANEVLPFGPTPVSEVGGRDLYFSAGGTHEIVVYSSEGVLNKIVRLELEPRPLTQAHIEAWLDQFMHRASWEPARRQALRDFFAEAPFPSTIPVYARLMLDADGNLWAQEYPEHWSSASSIIATDTPTHWYVIDPDGGYLGNVAMPARFIPYQIGADFVLGKWQDDFDVEHVRMHALIKD